MVKRKIKNSLYIPEQQDLVEINFDRTNPKELWHRRKAVVLSNSGYSKLTGLVVVSPIITTIERNMKTKFLIPISQPEVQGFANSMQFFSLDFKSRQIKHLGFLNTLDFVQIKTNILNILE